MPNLLSGTLSPRERLPSPVIPGAEHDRALEALSAILALERKRDTTHGIGLRGVVDAPAARALEEGDGRPRFPGGDVRRGQAVAGEWVEGPRSRCALERRKGCWLVRARPRRGGEDGTGVPRRRGELGHHRVEEVGVRRGERGRTERRDDFDRRRRVFQTAISKYMKK